MKLEKRFTAQQAAEDLRTIRDNKENIYDEMTRISHDIEAKGDFDEQDITKILDLIDTIKSIAEDLFNEIYVIHVSKIEELREKVKIFGGNSND